jgi:hypothetical protein
MATTGAGMQEELAERRGAGLVAAELLDERAMGKGWPACPLGNSHRLAGLAAVFMVARLAASSVSIAAKGSGAGAGSPRR